MPRTRDLLVPLLLLAMARCSGGACDAPRLLSDIPLLRNGDEEIVPVTMDGQPAGLTLDSGATQTTLTPQALADLNLASHLSYVETAVFGGTYQARIAELPTLKLGGAEVTDATVWVDPLSEASLGDDPSYGLLGSDLLTNFDFDLDAGNDRLALYDGRRCPISAPPWQAPFQEVDIPRALNGSLDQSADVVTATSEYHERIAADGGKILLRITLDGRDVTALLDTGASHSAVR